MQVSVIVLLLCSTVASAAGVGDAEAFRRAGIEPVVSPDDYRAYLEDLDLGQAEIEAADFLLEDYADGMRQLLVDLQETQSSDRVRLDAALDGKIRLSASEIRTLRLSLRGAVREAWATADARLDEMVEWASLLSAQEAAQQQEAVGRFYRRVFLTGHDREGLVDVGSLATEAASGDLPQIDQRIVESLREYTQAMAQSARGDALAVRAAKVADAIAALENDKDERVTLQREAATRWKARMQLQDAAAAQVASTLESHGPAVLQKWTDRVNAAFFPSVWGVLDASVARDWIERNGTPDQQQAANACFEATNERIRALRLEAVSLLREGRSAGVDLDHEAASLVQEATDVRMRYLRNSGERSMLERELFECVVRPLSDGQRAAIRRIIAVGR